MKNIPHLNLNDFLTGDSKTKNEFIEKLGKGFSEIGFIAIKGHLLDDRTKETKEVEFCNMHVIKELLVSVLSKYEDIIQARRKYPTR